MYFITIKEAKEKGLIPKYYWEFVPDNCSICGSPIETTYTVGSKDSTLTKIRCSNPHCPLKVSRQCVAFLQYFGVKGFGNRTAWNYIKDSKCKSLTDFIRNPPFEYSEVIKLIRCSPQTYENVVHSFSLPYIKERGKQIFQGIKNYSDFISKIEEAGGLYNYLQLHVGGSGTLIMQFMDILDDYSCDLEAIDGLFPNLQKPCNKTLEVVITGSLRSLKVKDKSIPVSKDTFLKALNTVSEPLGVHVFRSDAINKCFRVVADYETANANYLAGKARNKLITSQQLFDAFVHLAQEDKAQKETVTTDTKLFGGTE